MTRHLMTLGRARFLLGPLAVLAVLALLAGRSSSALAQAADPLPSWADGTTKQAILAFVARTTRPGEGFALPSARIAVFDDDGTLWPEQPMSLQLAFAIDRVKAMAPQNPEWRTREPFRSLLQFPLVPRDNLEALLEGLLAGGGKALAEVVAASHAGMTTEEFALAARDWLATARHPRFHRPWAELAYQPMIELLAHLRANGYRTYVVSAGGVELLRVFAERVYGVPPEQVVGGTTNTRFEISNGEPVLVREHDLGFTGDHGAKPVAIHEFLGRPPVLAFGSSDGDLELLQWTAAGKGPRFVAIVHHTDADREWAYDRASPIGKLDRALDHARAKGWTIVDLKRDWNRVFPGDP